MVPTVRFAALSLLLTLAATARASPPSWPALTTAPAPLGGGERDAALIVGIERYAEVAAIPGARQNAEDWYLFLTSTLKVPTDNVTLLRDREGTVEKLTKYAEVAARAVGEGGTLWVIFIGHGAPARDGRDGVLVGYDAQQDPDSLYARSVSRSALLSAARFGPTHQTVMVLDTCFSGRGATGEPLIAGLQPVIALRPAQPSASTSLVLTAAAADQFAGPLPSAERPAFTYLLLGALRGWGDGDRDGLVTLDEAYTYTSAALRTLVKGRSQTPQRDGTSTFSLRASERGPDLSAMVLSAPAGASELSFGSTTQIQVPKFKVAQGQGLTQLNLAAERALEAAMDAEESKSATPEAKASAWCALAKETNNNSYLETASTACKGWRSYAGAMRAQRAGLVEHYHTLAGYLQLKRKTAEQRLSAIDAFLSSYGSVADPWVAAVRQARGGAAAGAPVVLADGVEALEARCRSMDAEACAHLGGMAMKGTWPLTQDLTRGTRALQQACDGNAPLGCRLLGDSYLEGPPEAQQPARALTLYQRACEQDDGSGCHRLGQLVGAGKGAMPDLSRAAALEEQACDLGEAAGCLSVSGLFSAGRGVPVDPSRAASFRARACQLGDARGCTDDGSLPLEAMATEPTGVSSAPPVKGACVGDCDTRPRERGWAFAAAGGAVALVVGGAVAGSLAGAQATRARTTPQVNVGTYQEAVAAGRSLGALADVCFVLGALSAGASVYLFVSDAGAARATPPAATPASAGLTSALLVPLATGGAFVLSGAF